MWSIAAALAAPNPPPKTELPKLEWQVDATQLCLPSGLMVDVITRPNLPIVTVTTVIGGGMAAETEATRGAAHLAEHLWFESRPDDGVRVWDLQAGLTLSASTTTDATIFTTYGSAADLPELLRLEVARLVDPLRGVTEATVAHERQVIASELRYRGEHSVRAALRYLDAALWPADHPYAASVASLEAADALTLEEVRSYVAASYVPASVAIRVEGPMDAERVRAALSEHIPSAWLEGSTARCGHPPAAAAPPKPASTSLVTVEAPVFRPSLYIGWSLPSEGPKESARAELAAAVLDEIVRGAVGFARQTGTADVRQGCWLARATKASKVVCSIEFPDLDTAKQGLELVRNTLDHQWIIGQESVRNPVIRERASEVLIDTFEALDSNDEDHVVDRAKWSYHGVVDPTAARIEGVYKTEVPHLTAFAERWLGKDRMAAVLLVPARPTPAVGVAGAAADPWAFPPPTAWKPAPARLRAEVVTLENGLEIWAAGSEAPLLARSSVVAQGGATYTPVLGATEALEVAELFGFVPRWDDVRDEAPHLRSLEYGDTSVETHLVGPAHNLDVAMWAHAAFSAPELDLGLRQSELDATLLALIERLGKVGGLTEDGLRASHVLPGDPAATPWWERMAAAKVVPSGQVIAWERTLWSPGNATLVVTSPYEGVRVQASVSKRLGGWKPAKKPMSMTRPTLPPAAPPKVWAIEGESVVSSIEATCRVPARDDANAAAWEVLLPIVDRALFHALRDGLGLYVAQTHVAWLDRRAGLLEVVALAAPDQAAAAVSSIRSVLAGAADGLPDEVVAFGRLAAAHQIAVGAADQEAVHGALVTAAREGRTVPDPVRLRAAVDAVDSAALAALLADCAGHEAITVMGPPAPGLEAERLDWVARDTAIAELLR